jgi:integrase
MGAVDLPYVNSFTDRHGRTRYYFRYRGERRPLKGKPGDAVFQESYDDAKAELLPAEADDPNAPFAEGTLGWVIERFKESEDFTGTAAGTQEVYHRRLDWIKANWGRGQIADLEERHVRKMRIELRETPTVANRIIYFVGRLWRFAKEELEMDRLGPSPAREVEKAKHEQESHPAWPLALCAAFERLPVRKLVTAYMLFRYTGQRRSDVAKMRWSQFDGSAIEVVQQKTGTYVWIPCHRALREYLATLPRENDFILASSTGGGFAPTSITTMICDAARDLGFPGFSPHGLRHLAGSALAESGCSTQEIMSILGHLTEREAAVYVKQADRKVMAQNAITKWDR